MVALALTLVPLSIAPVKSPKAPDQRKVRILAREVTTLGSASPPTASISSWAWRVAIAVAGGFIAAAVAGVVLTLFTEPTNVDEPILQQGDPFLRDGVIRFTERTGEARSWDFIAAIPDKIDNRQASVVIGALVPLTGQIAVSELEIGEVAEGWTVCIELLASSFQVQAAEQPPCARSMPLTHAEESTWAWSLAPKEGVAGPQSVVFSVSVSEDENHSTVGVITHKTDVESPFFERNPWAVSAVLPGVFSLAAVIIAAALLKFWRPTNKLPRGGGVGLA